jgi:hypothetical protein
MIFIFWCFEPPSPRNTPKRHKRNRGEKICTQKNWQVGGLVWDSENVRGVRRKQNAGGHSVRPPQLLGGLWLVCVFSAGLSLPPPPIPIPRPDRVFLWADWPSTPVPRPQVVAKKCGPGS